MASSRSSAAAHFQRRLRRCAPSMAGCARTRRQPCVRAHRHSHATTTTSVPASDFLSSLKLDKSGLCSAVAQHIDTGEILMAAFATPEAVRETLDTGLATFYSRSRNGPWTKGLTSGNTIRVVRLHYDCDSDCLVYLGVPRGPACHTGARTCFFSEARPRTVENEGENEMQVDLVPDSFPQSTLFQLQNTIADRKRAAGSAGGSEGKPSWTAKLLDDPVLLCEKVREEANELCEALENREGKERVASEMADVLYHSMVLLGHQQVPMEDVLAILRKRFATSGIEEKASRRSGDK